MSNAKWRKTFGAVAASSLGLKKSLWKFIHSENIYDWPVPRVNDLCYYHLRDGRLQPVEYKWIEWIRFPRTWHPKPGVGYTESQDIEGLKRVLSQTAQLHVEEDEHGLTLFGYGR